MQFLFILNIVADQVHSLPMATFKTMRTAIVLVLYRTEQCDEFALHSTIQLLQSFKSVSCKWIIGLESASSWSHDGMDLSDLRRITSASHVTTITMLSADSTFANLFERNAKSSCLLVGSFKKSIQLTGSLFLPSHFLLTPLPLFSSGFQACRNAFVPYYINSFAAF